MKAAVMIVRRIAMMSVAAVTFPIVAVSVAVAVLLRMCWHMDIDNPETALMHFLDLYALTIKKIGGI